MKRLLWVALAVAGCSPHVDAIAQFPPAPYDTVAIAGHNLYVPHGFKVNIFAEGLNGVRSLVLGPGNVVYAAQTGGGRIVSLPDANADGVADSIHTVVGSLSSPFGLAFRGDTMYVSQSDRVMRFAPGSTTPVVIIDSLPSGGHSTRTILFGPDGKLYVAVGSSCNMCDETDSLRAAVTQFNPDGSGKHIFATGLRNSVGLAFNPTTHELWANNNDRDNLGDNLPPEHLNILKDGKWYGWPQCYLPGKPNPDYPGTVVRDCATVEPPAGTFQAHSAPLGLAFYTGTLFPAEYQGDAFMTFHGSWNRSIPTGAKVVRVHLQAGKVVSSSDFITGWLPPGATSVSGRWGRPVSLLVLPDGSLLISDDEGGRIWRVRYGN
jgi:glucose/arabinose dehydrogenase